MIGRRNKGRTFHAQVGLVAASLGLSACASASPTEDVRHVRELTRIEELPEWGGDVEPVPAKDVHALLREPLTQETAVRIALLNNRRLRAQIRRMGVARGHLIEAGTLPNPIFEVEMLPERNTEFEYRLEYDVTAALLTATRTRAAKAEVQASRYRTAAAVIELGFDVRAAFLRMQAAQQRLSLGQRTLDAFAAARDASRALAEAGNLRELDLAAQEAAYEKARVAVAMLELEVADRREALQRLLGLHGDDTGWSIAASMPVVPEAAVIPSDLEAKTLSANLDLQVMRRELESLAADTGANRARGWWPDVAVDVHALQGNPEAVGGGRDVSWGAGVSVGLPVFDRRQGRVKVLESTFDAELETYHGAAILLRSEARQARNQLASAHRRAMQYQDVIVPAQARVTEQTLLQYNAMQVGVFQLLAAHREQLDVETAGVNTRLEYWIAATRMQALLAGKSVGAQMSASENFPGNDMEQGH